MGKRTEAIIPNLQVEFPGSGDRLINDPNEWFKSRYPDHVEKYGPAFVVGKWIDQFQQTHTVPLHLNIDFMAGLLGGDARLGHQVVYHREEDRFYYWEPYYNAFCATTVEKLQLQASNYLLRCAQACSRLVDVQPLVDPFRSAKILNTITQKATAMLEADSSFFTGESGHRRYMDGGYIEPTAIKSHLLFVQNAVVAASGASLTVPDAYQRYRVFCEHNQLPALLRSEFKALVAEVIREQFHIGVRHDIDNGRGQMTHGWRGVSLVEPAGDFMNN